MKEGSKNFIHFRKKIYLQLNAYCTSGINMLSKEEMKTKKAIHCQLMRYFHGEEPINNRTTEEERVLRRLTYRALCSISGEYKEAQRNHNYKTRYGKFSNTAKAMTDLQKEILCREKLGQEKQ